MKKMKRGLALLLVAVLSMGNAGCGDGLSAANEKLKNLKLSKLAKQNDPVTREIFAMDTYMTITCYGERAEEAAEASLAEIRRLDNMLSVGNADSEIAKINAAGSGSISEDTAVMVKKSLEIGENTGGKFDITIYPLMEAWGFTTGDFHVPEQEVLDGLLEHVDYRELQLDEENLTVTLGDQQGMDLGGIAKGFTSDRIMKIFEEYGVESGLVSLGGNVECHGTKPDGNLWRCGIQDPHGAERGELMGIVNVQDAAVITSGAYERYFTDEESGEQYHHIIDPATGYSADNGLISVTIVSPSGLLADGLSTAMYILGLEGACEYWRNYGSDFEMILMTDEDQVYVTKGLKDQFTSEYKVSVIE